MDMPHGNDEDRHEGSRRRFTHGGLDVEYDDPADTDTPTMTIGGVDVMIRREETGGFSAPMLNMHATFSSLDELARSLIDTSPVFLARRYPRSDHEEGR
jgi:hypothetical protein